MVNKKQVEHYKNIYNKCQIKFTFFSVVLWKKYEISAIRVKILPPRQIESYYIEASRKNDCFKQSWLFKPQKWAVREIYNRSLRCKCFYFWSWDIGKLCTALHKLILQNLTIRYRSTDIFYIIYYLMF